MPYPTGVTQRGKYIRLNIVKVQMGVGVADGGGVCGEEHYIYVLLQRKEDFTAHTGKLAQ